MHFRAITRIVGLLVILFSGTMILPGLVALIYRDGAGRAFTQTFFVALAIGSILWWPNRREKGELKSREGFLIVVLFWTVLGSVGALPFIFSESPNLTITDAFFESFSRVNHNWCHHAGGAGFITACHSLLSSDAAMVLAVWESLCWR
ncbi:trk system potassium uptake protein [Salmonella enterica subsp. arizonae]|nr:trk system potassium uptake protein [Salmonella enterica subsp. arizonae]